MVVYYKVGNGEIKIPGKELESLLEEVFKKNLERFGYYPRHTLLLKKVL